MRTNPTLRYVLALLLASWLQSAARGQSLPGTQPLDWQGDLAARMVDGIDRFLLRETAQALERRPEKWRLDASSAARLATALEQKRAQLRQLIGAVDRREDVRALEYVAGTGQPSLVGRGQGYEVHAVRWPVLRGVDGEGLLLVPTGRAAVADCVALPDADQTPEMLCGLAPGVAPESQFVRRLAESGCRVLIPVLMDRKDTYSGILGQTPTNEPHREWIYRQAYEMGRHIIGYEVQKVLAAIDYFSHEGGPGRPIGVIGYGEGGLLAFYAGALDTRIGVTLVSGYFGSRQSLWQEPIYRNVWSLLDEFGDAEVARLIDGRSLIIEASRVPDVGGPPAPRQGHLGRAAPGRLVTPELAAVDREYGRAVALANATRAGDQRWALVPSGNGTGPFGSAKAVDAFRQALGPGRLEPTGPAPARANKGPDVARRFKRQFDQLVEYTQGLMRESEYTRRAFWAKADRKSRSVDRWQQTTGWYRDYFANEVIGRFDRKPLPPNPRLRQVYDEPKYTGYEVVLDVFPDVFAYGILLMPKDLKPGERRPVVVCQHGLEGRPQDVADPNKENPAYHRFACRLAERGFITFAPQNPYIGHDRFRTLQRKANPLKKSLFSIIVPQHQQIVDWLAGLPMVDPDRIGFYGLSYGGKTAMRVPALVTRYCLSICSADFNEWIWKNTSARSPYSYLQTPEYEMFEFDLGNTFNYAEMAGLIAPRPFMVERGHDDGVAPDEWVAYEYARVRHLYSDLKIPERTTIEFFDGPHTIHGVGTFTFLHEKLRWPEKK